jgi:lipoprotein-anchoring transpeptidase ErfK/SrfK
MTPYVLSSTSRRWCALACTAALVAAFAFPAAAAGAKHAAPPAKTHKSRAPAPLTVAAINDARFPAGPSGRLPADALVRASVLLDRAHFSPGEIDGAAGSNLKKALAGYQQQNALPVSGTLDAATWDALHRDNAPVLADYTITAADVAGPFVPIPKDMAKKAELPAMAYTTPLEGLAERFHASPKLLAALNRGRDFGREGTPIVVPNVEIATPLAKGDKGTRVVVSKSQSTVSVVDATDRVIAQFPASVGSEHDPLPLGQWKINGVSRNPKFHYNPQLFWDADPGDKKATIPPGPNNPVGVVWIDLSKDHYGIHGTPEPATIGKTQSHGCIRLTNWDAWALSQVVHPGMPAVLQE